MAVVYQAKGTAAAGTTAALTVGWPGSTAINDIALLFVTSSADGTTETLSTPNGFSLVGTYVTGTGTSGTKLSVFWCRAHSTTMSSPVVAAGSDFKYGIIVTFRGAKYSGSPIDIFSGGVKTPASTTLSVPSITTTVPNALYVSAATSDLDSSATFVSNVTNANLSNVTIRHNAGTTNGGGGGIAVVTGDQAAAGATGISTYTVTSNENAYLTLALIPETRTPGMSNDFEGGTDGVDITSANSGGISGLAIASTAKNTGTTLIFSSLRARGTLALRINFAVSAAGYATFNWIGSARTVMRYYIYFKDYVQDGYFELSRIITGSGHVRVTIASQQPYIYDIDGGSFLPFKLQPNSWYRFEFAVTIGTTSTNGRIEFAYYDGDSTTPIYYFDSPGRNTGTTAFSSFRIGAPSGPTPAPMDVYYDDLMMQELASGFIGPSATQANYDKTQFLPFFQ